MQTHLGSFGRGQAPIALFAGVRAEPGGRGFGGYTDEQLVAMAQRQNAAGGGSLDTSGGGFSWSSVLDKLAKAGGTLLSSYLGNGKAAVGATPGTGYTPASTMPSWVVPAAIAGGVVVVGGALLYAFGGKKRR